MNLEEIINGIVKPDIKYYEYAKKHFDGIAKPIGSFGKLEDIIAQICSIEERKIPSIKKRAVVVFCSDNGIVEEGVSQVGQFVTANVFRSINDKTACISNLAKETSCDVFAVDMGINDIFPKDKGIHKKIAMGTDNFLKGHAMSYEDAKKAIFAGFEMAEQLNRSHYDIAVAGEMGIGNTTTSAAVVSCLLNLTVEDVTGKGAGLSDEGLLKKIDVIKKGISINAPDCNDVLDVISKIGGFDIAAMCGFYLGCAYYKMPCILDGFIALSAALCAVKLCSITKEYLIPSHKSSEKGMKYVLDHLNLSPVLDGNFHQGEGCGAVMLLPLLDLGITIYNTQQSFADMEMKPYERFN